MAVPSLKKTSPPDPLHIASLERGDDFDTPSQQRACRNTLKVRKNVRVKRFVIALKNKQIPILGMSATLPSSSHCFTLNWANSVKYQTFLLIFFAIPILFPTFTYTLGSYSYHTRNRKMNHFLFHTSKEKQDITPCFPDIYPPQLTFIDKIKHSLNTLLPSGVGMYAICLFYFLFNYFDFLILKKI